MAPDGGSFGTTGRSPSFPGRTNPPQTTGRPFRLLLPKLAHDFRF